MAAICSSGAGRAQTPTNLIVNGDFSQAGTVCQAAATSVTGWTVVNNVDIDATSCSGIWTPNNSEIFFIDLTGSHAESGINDVGTLSQTVDTVIGTKYQLSFAFAGNPQWQTLTSLPNDSPVKAMAVYLNGSIAGAYMVNTAGAPSNDARWSSETILFTAKARKTTISFHSLNGSVTNPSDFGPMLGEVVLIVATN